MTRHPVVIVGGGHAAAQLCASLHELGHAQGVQLVCAEAMLPYQRPPLSKGHLKNPQEFAQLIRPAEWYARAGIHCHLQRQATHLNPARQTLTLDNGDVLGYEQLVVATGTRARELPLLSRTRSNVHVLRTAADADALRAQLHASQRVVVLGGGFIGLEVAATAQALGKSVTLLEMAPRLMGRSVSQALSEQVRASHAASGMDIRLATALQGVQVQAQRVVAVNLADAVLPCDLVLVAIGAEPETALAQAAGLVCDNGIWVDAAMRTSDPHIFAMGDCASFALEAGRRLRLESIQNAQDQAKVVAQGLLGHEAHYRPIPWFWSEQGALRLQMVGLWTPEASSVCRQGTQPASVSWFHHVGDRLVCVESVNAPMDHMMARKLLALGVSPTPAELADPTVPLKSLCPNATP